MQATNRDVVKIYWAHARRYRALLSAMALTSTAAYVLEVYAPLFLKRLFDLIGQSQPSDAVFKSAVVAAALYFAAKFGTETCRRIYGFCVVVFQPYIIADLQETSFRHLLGHSYEFFTNSFVGSLVRRVNRFGRAFENIMDTLVWVMWGSIVTIVGIVFSLYLRFPRLAAMFTAWALIYVILQYFAARWKLQLDLKRSRVDSEATGALSDAITNNVAIKLETSVRFESQLLHRVLGRWRDLYIRGWRRGEYVIMVQTIFSIALEAVLIGYGLVLWRRGLVTIGDLVMVQSYAYIAMERTWNIGRSIRQIFESFADAREMAEIFNEPYGVKDIAGAKKLAVAVGAIEMSKVNFTFQGQKKVLDDFSVSIKPREKVALVGPSGAGKTTVTKLLLRFFDPRSGRIRIDGQDIGTVTQESLRQNLALVPQEPVLFHRTLLENIRYGRRDATKAEIIEAAKKARCHEFISKLPSGYGTYVGERGIKLSGGERQRVAIARAILKNAPILILDEATSSLDSESESLIQEALKELMMEKTVIAIAHRLSTVMQMDRIIVVEAGHVVATGTHGELLKKAGIYRKLWNIQAGGFLG